MVFPAHQPSVKQPPPDFLIRSISPNLQEDPNTGWYRGIVYYGPTSYVDELLIHAGVLSAHVTPHLPHCHDHEEIHINLSDHFECISCDAGSDIETARPLGKASMVFTDSHIPHTFRNTASRPGLYLHIRWRNESGTSDAGLKRLRFYYSPGDLDSVLKPSVPGDVGVFEIYSGPSLYLRRLRALFLSIPAGRVVPLHHHPHEVIFVLVNGSVDILGKKVDAPGVAFMGAHMPHYLINNGPGTAELYAFNLE